MKRIGRRPKKVMLPDNVELVELDTVDSKPMMMEEDRDELVQASTSQPKLVTPEDTKAKRARLSNTPLTTMAGAGDG
jgi:hypothetical protein